MSNSTRPSSSYDERFVVPLEASRRGAHRARVSPIMAMLPVVAVVGVVLGAVALVYVFLGGMGGSGADVAPTTSLGPTATPTSTPSSSAQSTEGASATSSSATVDKSIAIAVYNGTSPTVSGLARKAGGKLTAAGWTLGPVETWTGNPVSVTTIYYGSADQRATAQAVAKALGRGVVKLSPTNAKSGIAVVVGNDYPSAGGSHSTSTKSSAASSRSHSASSSSSMTAPPGESGTPAN